MPGWFKLIIPVIALTLHAYAGADTKDQLRETIAQINTTLSEAQCRNVFPRADVTRYTFAARPTSHTVTFTATHTQNNAGRSTQRIERIEISTEVLQSGLTVVECAPFSSYLPRPPQEAPLCRRLWTSQPL